MGSFRRRCSVLALVSAALLAMALPSSAQRVKNGRDALDTLAFAKPETWVTTRGEEFSGLRAEMSASPVLADFDAFQAGTDSNWTMVLDRVTGRPSLIEGGTQWIPGRGIGNYLRASDLGVTDEEAWSNRVPVQVVADKAFALLRTYPNLLGVDPTDLALMEGASGPMSDYLYYLDFQWTYRGLPVEKAHVVFRLNHGNLVQFGQEFVSDSIRRLDATPAFDARMAWEIVRGYIGGASPGDEVVEPGRLLIQPLSTPALLQGAALPPGEGLEYRLVYVLAFRREGVAGTWEARVDAHTGEILSFKDEDKYGHIQGGVYKTDANPTKTEVTMPFPFANYGTTTYTDAAGNWTGKTGTCTMSGRTGSAAIGVGGVKITDNCGSISLAADSSGLIDFGSGPGTDCTTPGFGGAGNTHAARTQYWNITQIKIKAYTYLSGFTTPAGWLRGVLTANVNLTTTTCNANWNGSTVNFYRRGTTACGNTGELPGVSLHEWGHGMDSNDGNGSSPEGGTGETYGDVSALLQTHQSCMGGGFFDSNCDGYGDACLNCTGVRELDYAKHRFATPATPNGFNKVNCPTATCVGPCNLECHCESAPSSQAVWDLANRDLVAAPYNLDIATAWQLVDKFWYASRPTATGAFVCGANTSTATGNLFQVFRVVDDCDGNLNNGTPHSAAMWAAFSRHEIGNSSAVKTDNNCSCAGLTSPLLNGNNTNGVVSLIWSAVTGAASYDIYRNETACEAGYTKMANVSSSTLSYADTSVYNGVVYYYRVQALGTGTCPPSAMSNCMPLAPQNCTPPAAPTNISAAATAANQITVGWTGSGATYNILRATGACPGGAYALVRSEQATSPWVDTTVSGGTTYSYMIVALEAMGQCQSYASACASATATGPCTLPPTFAGLTSASNPAGSTCGLVLAWSAGSSNCSAALTYNVYRSTTTPFAPAPGNRIASGLSASPYTDQASLVFGTTYYYIARAYDAVTGTEDSNTVTMSGTPGPLTTQALFSDGFETGDLGWVKSCPTAPCNVTETIGIMACTAHGGSNIYRWGGAASSPATCGSLYKASMNSIFGHSITVPASATQVRLSFWHRYNIGSGDGTFLRLSLDGTTWYYIPKTPSAQWLQGTYNTNITYSTSTRDVWAGQQNTFTQVILDLDEACWNTFGWPAAGHTFYIGFNGYSNTTTQDIGWFVDDVLVTYTGPSACTTQSGGTPKRVPYTATPTRITRNDTAGTDLAVTWDATNCSSSDYHILWGYGGNVTTLGGNSPILSGSRCNLGTTGTLSNWNSGVPDPANDPGPGKFVWFLVVGDNDDTTEGSWGLTTDGGERGGTAASGQCTCTTKDTSSACATD